jgi:hypothetical protein
MFQQIALQRADQRGIIRGESDPTAWQTSHETDAPSACAQRGSDGRVYKMLTFLNKDYAETGKCQMNGRVMPDLFAEPGQKANLPSNQGHVEVVRP